MFEEIISTLESTNKYSVDLVSKIRNLCNYWNNINNTISSQLEEIIEKYQYENLKNIRRENSQVTHLEFWKSIGAFSLSPALFDHDIDINFMHFVEDFHSKIDYSKITEMNDKDLELYVELSDRLFYTWISFLWQESNGSKTGIPTCTVENNSVKMFYFNDFLFDNISSFHNKWEDKRIQATAFNRKLKPIEIYARTNSHVGWGKNKTVWIFNKENTIIELILEYNLTKIFGVTLNEEILHEPDTNYDNSYIVASSYFIKKSNDLINQGWILKEKEGDI
jgi:hypothetical protein